MLRLLVIDDDINVREKMMLWLLKDGYEVECAFNGEYGLQLLDKKQFDLLITEIIMPQKDGIEIIMAIRKCKGKIPIIALSGGGKTGPASYYLELARQFGADRTLPKPVHEELLLPVVHELIGKAE